MFHLASLRSPFLTILPGAVSVGLLLADGPGRQAAAGPIAEKKPAIARIENPRPAAPPDIREELALLRSPLGGKQARDRQSKIEIDHGVVRQLAGGVVVNAAIVQNVDEGVAAAAAVVVAEGAVVEGAVVEGAVGVVVVDDAVVDLEAAPLDAVEAQVANIEQQFASQFRNVMKSELYFVRKVCGLNAAQFRSLSVVGEKAQREATKKFADVQRRMMKGQLQPNEGSPYPDPRAIIAKVIADSLQSQMSAQQHQRYQVELDQRLSFRKRVAIRNFVFRLDNQLVLSDEQRSLISDDLLKNWQEAWGNQLEYLIYDQFSAHLPDEPIVPHLNAAQKEVWTLSKSNSRTSFGWGGMGQVIENLWEVQLDDDAGELIEIGPAAQILVPARLLVPAPADEPEQKLP